MAAEEEKTLSDDAPHLLVVDDDTRIRSLLSQYLTNSGFRVTMAGSAAEARRKLEGIDFDLLILDVMMPGETGVSLTRSLREQKNVPILMLTALSETDSRIDGLAAGADDDALAALDRYAHAVGLAFQVRDDILDVEGESTVLGKTVGKDAAADKPTFPSIIGMDASREHLARLTADALDAIAPLGERGALLEELARYAAARLR